ncbi:MAG: acyl-homoserine-lactone synthase [Nitrospirota bacterium]
MNLQTGSSSYGASSILSTLGRTSTFTRLKNIEIKENDYIVKNLTEPGDLQKAYQLRHLIFAEELGWVSKTEAGLEIDDYDKNAVSFGVFDKTNNLSAYMRLIMAGKPFMMENDFSFLVSPEHHLKKGMDTAEVSRLCVAPGARNDTISGNFGLHSTSIFLLKGVYQWCLKNRIDYLYAVTEEKIYRLYRAKGFPFKLIGEPRQMPDGVIAAALIMDWKEFENLNELKRPRMFKWFCQSTSMSPKSSAMAVA